MTGQAADYLEWITATLQELELVANDVDIDAQTGLLGEGIGLDSVEVLQLVSAIEDGFGLTLEDEELLPEHFRSVGALAGFIAARIRQ